MVQTVDIDASDVGKYRDLAIYWGESLRLAVSNRPEGASVIVTLADDRQSDPRIEVAGTDQIDLPVATLEALSEGAEFYYNTWLHQGDDLSLLTHGRFVTRASITPRLLSPAPLALSGVPAATGTVGQAYAFAPVVDGGVGPFAFSMAGTALPTGLDLDPVTGVIAGTPTTAAAHTGLILRVTDSTGAQADLTFALDIAAATPVAASFTAGAVAPRLIVDGDSIMANNPGTRPLIEQYVGDLVRLPAGFQQAIGGQTGQQILDGLQGTVDLIVPGETIVLMGPIGANLAPGSSTFAEVAGQMDQIFDTLLTAGAVVVAVPTLPDEDIHATNDKKDQLRDHVYAYDHPNFHAVDIGVANRLETGAAAYGTGAFDPYAMKNDQSHPNGAGSRYLARQIRTVLRGLVASDIFDEGTNLLSVQDAGFAGSVAASGSGVSGTIPAGWSVSATGSGVTWTCAANGAGDFVVTITGAAANSTLTLTKSVTLNASDGDVFDLAAEVDVTSGATGLRMLRAFSEGSTALVSNSAFGPEGTLRLRTPSTAYDGAQVSDDMSLQAIVDAEASVTLTFRKAGVYFVENLSGVLQITGTPATAAQVGTGYTFTPSVTGGTAPHVFDLASGSLPAGLSLNTITGAITGTPTTAGEHAGIALRVTDQAGATATLAAFTLTVAEAGAPENTSPPQIDNTNPQVGDLLTVSPGSWTNAPTGYGYQWRSSGFVISGATGASYTVQPGDVDQTLRVDVTASNASGSSATVSTAETATVTAAAAPMATWDSSVNNASDLSYSDSDRTVTSSAGSDRHTRGAEAMTGKAYFEVSALSEIRAIGIADQTITALSGQTNGVNRSFWSGDLVFWGSSTSIGMTFANGDRVQVAVDVDNDLMWLRKNGTGDWNGSASADPASGTGGFDISGMTSATLYPYVSTKPAGAATLDGTADRQTYAAPTGFSPLA